MKVVFASITDISNETRQIREKPWIYLEQTPRFSDLKRKKEEKVLPNYPPPPKEISALRASY